jgi:NAD-dependent dihydropyrimidine dehydrogenase PreA subunit
MIVIDAERCTACGVCAAGCPQEAISLTGNMAVIDHERCIDCGACLELCAQNAIYQVIETGPALAPPRPVRTLASSDYRPPTVERTPTSFLSQPLLRSAWAWALPLATRAAAGLVGRWLDSRTSASGSGSTSRALFRPGTRYALSQKPKGRGTAPLFGPFGSRYGGGRRRRWRGGRDV